eukprot:5899930-Prymnesium_polylepis.1
MQRRRMIHTHASAGGPAIICTGTVGRTARMPATMVASSGSNASMCASTTIASGLSSETSAHLAQPLSRSMRTCLMTVCASSSH